MKTITKFSVLVAFIIATCVHSAIAQTKADIFNPKTKITWLGLDFSQTKFIGSEAAYKATGELINSDFVNRYIPAWANLFITEPTVYNVAKAVHRDSVHFALLSFASIKLLSQCWLKLLEARFMGYKLSL
jgi:hypothetical protein